MDALESLENRIDARNSVAGRFYTDLERRSANAARRRYVRRFPIVYLRVIAHNYQAREVVGHLAELARSGLSNTSLAVVQNRIV